MSGPIIYDDDVPTDGAYVNVVLEQANDGKGLVEVEAAPEPEPEPEQATPNCADAFCARAARLLAEARKPGGCLIPRSRQRSINPVPRRSPIHKPGSKLVLLPGLAIASHRTREANARGTVPRDAWPWHSGRPDDPEVRKIEATMD